MNAQHEPAAAATHRTAIGLACDLGALLEGIDVQADPLGWSFVALQFRLLVDDLEARLEPDE